LSSLIKIWAFAYRNLIFAKRNFFTFFELLFWPFVSIVSIGLMGVFLEFKVDIMNFILTGAITSGILQVAQLDVSYSLLYDVWSKSWKHTFLAPIDQYQYIVGGWLVGIIRGMVVFLIMWLFSWYFFRFYLPPWHATFLFLTGVFLNAAMLGMIVCVLIFFFGTKVDIVAWSSVALIMLFCGIYYPVNTLPAWARVVSQFIPLTYFLDYFRASYGFPAVFSHTLLKGFLETAIYSFGLLKLLDWAFWKSRKTGMILRLSE
jgi:ABC-2 type transport system permease protein